MSAARIREAAKVLRDAAEKATPGLWSTSANRGYVCADHPQVADAARVVADTDCEWPDSRHNAAYIALMSPPVALAIADWLDDVAVLWSGREFLHDDDGDPLTFGESIDSHAITLANTILGDRA